VNLHDGSPYWSTRDGLLATFPPLVEDCTCDVVVVGGNGISYRALAADYVASDLTGDVDPRASMYRLDRTAPDGT
jgi:hypothetical protein